MWFGAQLYKEGLLSDPTNVSNVFRNSMGSTCYHFSLASHERIFCQKKGFGQGSQFSKN
jgi:hypothetical protein